jgi:hypothetical protein
MIPFIDDWANGNSTYRYIARMETSRDDLEQRFRDLTDEELLARAGSRTLTEEAQQVAQTELALRGLTLPDSEPGSPELPPAAGPLGICTRFLLPMDAEIFAARLAAEGIAARVMDSDTIYANGAFHTSLGMGGVRVMVPESQMAEAQRVLAAFNAGEYAIDESFDPGP